jgi:hypothetical protein
VAAKYPNNRPSADDWTTTNAGMGRTKSNDKDPRDLNTNFVAEEYNQQNLEIMALADSLGLLNSLPTMSTASDHYAVREIMTYMARRADKAGVGEHFIKRVGAATYSDYYNNVGAAATAYTNAIAGDNCGVVDQTMGLGVSTGWETTDDHHHFRYTYCRFRCRVDTLAGAWAAGDTIEMGLGDFAGAFVRFYALAGAGPAWPVWTVATDDGVGGSASDTLTADSDDLATGWHVFELLTTSTGSHFFYDRGGASEEYKALAQAPLNAHCEVYLHCTHAAGGDHLYTDAIASVDTRVL